MFLLTKNSKSCTNVCAVLFIYLILGRHIMYEPTASWGTSGGLDGAVAMMWGCPTDWKTAELIEEGDQEKAPHVIGLLGGLAVRHRLRRILGPSVLKFNSEFLSDTAQYPWQLSLPSTACKLHRGLYADGFEVLPGEAGVIAPADCAIVVVTTPSGRVFMLHAGRDSLIDRKLIDTGQQSKKHESVIFAAWDQLDPEEAKESMWVVLPSVLPGGHFEHPADHKVHGEFNQKLVRHISHHYPGGIFGDPGRGMLSVPEIITGQLVLQCGLPRRNIHIERRCTHQEVDQDGQHVWWSHSRDVATGQTPGGRNLVVVINAKN